MSGIYAMLLGPWYYMVFITSPLSHIFVILDKQKNNLVLNIIVLISRILSITLGIYMFNKESIMVIVIFALIGFLLWLFTNSYVLKLVGIKIKQSIPRALLTLILGTIIISIPRIIMIVI